MCESTQFFFLVPLSIENVKLNGVEEYVSDERNSPILDLVNKLTTVDTILLKAVVYNENFNYINKVPLMTDDLDNWIVKMFPNVYSPFCHYPLLICFIPNSSGRVKYAINIPNGESDCYVHLLILFIQYIQLQNPRCELLYYLDEMTKTGKYNKVHEIQFSSQKNNFTRQSRTGCCFTNLFVSKNDSKVGFFRINRVEQEIKTY